MRFNPGPTIALGYATPRPPDGLSAIIGSSYVAGDVRSRQKNRMRRIRATGFSPQMARAIVALLLLLAIVLPIAANDVRDGINKASPFACSTSTASLVTAHITILLIVLITATENFTLGSYRKVPMREALRRKRIRSQSKTQDTETALLSTH